LAVIVVTGSAGFIGSHVVRALLSRGDRVIGVDNFDPFYDAALKRANARAAGDHELVETDVCDSGALRRLFERARPDSIIHLAAKAGVRPSLKDPAGYARTNVLGTQVVLDESARAGLSRLVIASSSSVYGNNTKTPFAETDLVDAPISPYAATKKACELIAHAHHAITKQPVACLRFFTVFGPRQRPDLAISTFMRRISRAEEIDMFGDGSMSRDFTFIDDVVAGVLAAHDRIDRFGYRVWNLGSDRPVRLDAMIAAIARVVGKEPRIRRLPMQPGDVERTWADLTRSGAELSYRPSTNFEEGLERQWAATAP
jgi:UDP-glucuronate 4-epimerase